MASTAGAAPRILVHGHRGARAVRPENTLAAFEYAIEAGADFLELDLAVTRDNALVVSHDPAPNAAICSGPGPARPIREMTLAEVRQWDCGTKRNPAYPKQQPAAGARIPALDEVLALAARGTFGFNIETKSFPDKPAAPCQKFARLVANRAAAQIEQRVIVLSFDFRTLIAMKRLRPS
jgi:glycerophosphoryl diester phosphodiesterase